MVQNELTVLIQDSPEIRGTKPKDPRKIENFRPGRDRLGARIVYLTEKKQP